MDMWNESLIAKSGSHDQDGRPSTYGENHSKIFFSRTGGPFSTKIGMWYWVLQPIIVCANDDPGMTLTYLTARFILGKSENYGFFLKTIAA